MRELGREEKEGWSSRIECWRRLRWVHCSLADVSSLLTFYQTLLSPGGAFYLVTIPQNKPFEIIDRMRARGLDGEVSAVAS